MSSNSSPKRSRVYIEDRISSNIEINDIFDELSNENKRLLNELLFANKCLKSLITFKTFVDFISHKFKSHLNSNDWQTFEKLQKDIEDVNQLCDDSNNIPQKGVDSQNDCLSYKNLKYKTHFKNWIKEEEISSPILTESEDEDMAHMNEFTETIGNKDVVKCKFCLQLFISSDDYKRHLKVHTNSTVKPFVCYIPCGRSFSSLQDLKYHSNECHSDHSIQSEAINQNNPSIDSNGVQNKLKEWIQTNAPKISENVVNYNQNNDNSDHDSDNGMNFDDLEANDYILTETPFDDNSDHNSNDSSDSPLKQNKLIPTKTASKSKTKNKRIKCPIDGCYKTFVGRLSRQHLMSDHKDSDLNCSVDGCNQTFKLYDEFIKHLWTHPLYAGQCKRGPKSGVVEPFFKTEIRSGHTFYICTIDLCGKTFPKYRSVYKHYNNLHKRKQNLKIGCEWSGCQHRFKTKKAMKLHFSSTHLSSESSGLNGLNSIFLSDFNDSAVDSMATNVYEEQISGHNDSLVKCEWIGCDFECKSLNQLTKHTKRHFNSESFFCDICDKEYSTSQTLRDHMNRKHIKSEQMFECDSEGCLQTFNNKNSLQQHLYSTHRPKPFVCDFEGCSEAFSFRSKLKRHEANHLEPSLSCTWPGCEYKARCVANLKEHEFVHKPEVRRYVCEWPECGKTVRHLSNFTFHMRTHYNDLRYTCEWPGCQFRSVSHQGIKKHRKTHKN